MTNVEARENLVAISGELEAMGKLDDTNTETFIRALTALALTDDWTIELCKDLTFKKFTEVEYGECNEK